MYLGKIHLLVLVHFLRSRKSSWETPNFLDFSNFSERVILNRLEIFSLYVFSKDLVLWSINFRFSLQWILFSSRNDWFSGSEICKTKEKFSAKKAIYQKKSVLARKLKCTSSARLGSAREILARTPGSLVAH